MASTMLNTGDIEKWHVLEKWIKSEEVIPIIGPDALAVEAEVDGRTQTGLFYRLVAVALLNHFDINPSQEIVGNTWALHRAVTEILGRRLAGLDEIQLKAQFLIDQYASAAKPAECLGALLSIKAFNFFVTLTPDNIIERLLRQVSGKKEMRVIVFEPDASTKWLKSLASDVAFMRDGGRCVFKLLGSCSSKFALHDEDALEYLHKLQYEPIENIAEILKKLRQNHLLLIGCNPPDWLGRAMIRLANDNRLLTKQKQEFLCTCIDDADLRCFLHHYSPKTLMLEGELGEFFKKLAATFAEPAEPPASAASANSPDPQGPTVFVSYASDNAGFAQRLAESLLAEGGFGDVWLDKKKLRAGEDWSDRIEEAIVRCDFFMPVLSAEADHGKSQRVYWEEWKTASACANNRKLADAYLLPVGIDLGKPTTDSHPMIAYRHPEFFEKQIIHAPQGVLSAGDLSDLKRHCADWNNARGKRR